MSRLLLTAVAVAALLSEGFVLAVYAPGRVQAVSDRLAAIPEFSRSASVSETFVAGADGLERIDVLFLADRASDLTLHWQLLAVPSDGPVEPIAAGRRRLRLAAGRTWERFGFPAVAASGGRRFRFEVDADRRTLAPDAAAGPANALDNPLHGAYLLVGGVPQWGDMVFVARAQADTVAGRFEQLVLPALPAPFDRLALWLAGLAFLNVLAAITVAAMLDPRPRAGSAGADAWHAPR